MVAYLLTSLSLSLSHTLLSLSLPFVVDFNFSSNFEDLEIDSFFEPGDPPDWSLQACLPYLLLSLSLCCVAFALCCLCYVLSLCCLASSSVVLCCFVVLSFLCLLQTSLTFPLLFLFWQMCGKGSALAWGLRKAAKASLLSPKGMANYGSNRCAACMWCDGHLFVSSSHILSLALSLLCGLLSCLYLRLLRELNTLTHTHTQTSLSLCPCPIMKWTSNHSEMKSLNPPWKPEVQKKTASSLWTNPSLFFYLSICETKQKFVHGIVSSSHFHSAYLCLCLGFPPSMFQFNKAASTIILFP